MYIAVMKKLLYDRDRDDCEIETKIEIEIDDCVIETKIEIMRLRDRVKDAEDRDDEILKLRLLRY